MSRSLSSNMEDYLEAILELKEKNEVVRVRDIANKLELNRSTVTLSLKTLAKGGFVEHEKYGYVVLLSAGEKIARDVQRRHNLLIKFLHDVLALDYKQSALDACVMEHAMSPKAVKHLALFVEYIESCQTKGEDPDWLKKFKKSVGQGKRSSKK